MTYTVVQTQQTTLTYNSVLVSGVKSIKGIGATKSKEIDVTTLASTGKEFRIGLQDYGTVTVTLVRSLDDVGQAALLAAHSAQSINPCVIVLPAGTLTTLTFNALVQELSTDIDEDGVLMGECVLRVSGPVTLAT